MTDTDSKFRVINGKIEFNLEPIASILIDERTVKDIFDDVRSFLSDAVDGIEEAAKDEGYGNGYEAAKDEMKIEIERAYKKGDIAKKTMEKFIALIEGM